MRLLYAIFLTAALLTCGCSSKTTEVKHLDKVILLNVQGLWGGQDLWISADGKVTCRFVTSSDKKKNRLEETRYEFVLSENQKSSLIQLVNKHNFESIKTKDRYGVPDEPYPIIFIESEEYSHAIGKWGGDKHKDFDPIYNFLLQIARSGTKTQKNYQGPYDRNWRPNNFPDNKIIYDLGKPKLLG